MGKGQLDQKEKFTRADARSGARVRVYACTRTCRDRRDRHDRRDRRDRRDRWP